MKQLSRKRQFAAEPFELKEENPLSDWDENPLDLFLLKEIKRFIASQ